MLGSPALVRRLAFALKLLAAVVAIPTKGYAQERDSIDLVLRSGTVVLSRASSQSFWNALRASGISLLHGVVWFQRDPTTLQRDSLRKLGIEILAPLPHGLFWAAIAATADTVAAPVRPRFYAKLDARARVDPELWTGKLGRYSVRREDGATGNYVINADSTLNAFALFHDGTSIVDAERILRSHARTLSRASDLGWKFSATLAEIRLLAELDVVRWIDLPLPPLVPENDKTRATINVDAVQNFNTGTGQVQGLGGQGVVIGVFDFGLDETHSDFGARVIRNDMGASSHATHIAGVIAGDGTRSTANDSWTPAGGGTATLANNGTAFQWRGMAPQAQLIDADANNAFVAASIGAYITQVGMDISNHSYTYSLDGAYTAAGDYFHDQLIRGDATTSGNPIPAREHVYSAGNNGQETLSAPGQQQQVGYFSLTKQSKNGIMVGNFAPPPLNEINQTSSLGPSYDGRIKPDVVAPGTQIHSTGYCSRTVGGDPWGRCTNPPSGKTERHNFYHDVDGSSDAAAAVTGMLALVLQQFAASYAAISPGWVLQPATLRAVTIQSAHDIAAGSAWYSNADGPVQAFTGPDFVTGYGMVDAKDAVDVIANARFAEDFVTNECDTRTWWVKVHGAAELKVTLAWDDWPGSVETPYTLPRIVNDLDLELIGPTSSTAYYPWLLDQTAVNAAGVAVPDASQACGSDLTIQRKVVPVASPKFVTLGSPQNVYDALSGGVLQPATKGRDHLNNAEQVVVSAPANGWWKIRVTGFRVPQPSQRFSLATSERVWAMIPIKPPKVFCWSSPNCGRIYYDRYICERIPKLCSPLEVKPGHLELTFANPLDAAFVPVDRLCLFLVNCPVCIRDGICRELDISFANLKPGFTIALYDAAGRREYYDNTSNATKRMRVRIDPSNSYVVAIQAGQRIERNKRYDVRVRNSAGQAIDPRNPRIP